MAIETIQQLLTTPYYAKKLDKVVDLTHNFLVDPDKEAYYAKHNQRPDKEVLGQFKIFDDYAPYYQADTFKILEYKMKRNQTIGSLTATGQEVPSTSAGQLLAVQGDMAKITLSHIYDEEIMKQMYELREAKIIPDGFLDVIFGSVKDLEVKVFKLGNVFTAQVWSTGKIRFTDPRTNIQLNLNYDVYPQLFPEPLTGNRTWDNLSTAQGINDLIALSDAFYDLNGYYPEAFALSKRAISLLMQQESTSVYAVSQGLINNNPQSSSNLPTRVSKKTLMQLSENIDELPKLVQFDAKYELETEPGSSMSFPYLPSHTVAILNPKSVERIWGLTLESAQGKAKGFGSNPNPRKPKGGIFVFKDEVLKISPPECRSVAAGRVIPWVSDARRIGALKVLAS